MTEPTDATPSLDSILANAMTGLPAALKGDTEPSEGSPAEASPEPTPEPEPSDEPEETPAEEGEEPSLEVDGVKLTASEIKALKAQADKADALERKYLEATSDAERMKVWKQMDQLAQKHPALRDKLVGVFSEFETEATGEPIDNRTDEQKVRDEAIDALLAEANQQKVAAAGVEIDSFVKDYADRFPDIVKNTDEWMGGTLLKTVVDLFGEGPNVGPVQIKAALNHLVAEKGGFQKAQQDGEKKLAERLAKEPHGTRIVKGGAPRVAAEAPPVSIKGKDVDDTLLKGFRSMAGKLLTG